MARLNVNPTRMELTGLKKRLSTATRGHKLLKDKRDELMKQFLEVVRRNKTLREEVEEALHHAFSRFILVRGSMSTEMLEEALMFPKERLSLELSSQNIMSVNVPRLSFKRAGLDETGIFPYGYATTPAELDDAIKTLSDILPRLLELAEIEKSVQLMADEIEKTRRRVNALEYVMIPQLQETIRYISSKLEENERGNTTRLMKVKDMMVQQSLREQAARDAVASRRAAAQG
ncbi:MAG: V-type ATP synthase subunit D [Peptococcaceae bacterium]|nr:V-type ATP synthase subunit D [Peptococcaceae bacterium]